MLRILLGVAIALSLTSAEGTASTLQVSPARLSLSQAAPSDVMTLRNESARAIVVQIRTFEVVGNGGVREQLQPTRLVVASPPFATLEPGADYHVRVLRLSTEPVANDKLYRVIVDELPEPTESRRDGRVRFAIRYSIPVQVQRSD